MNSDELKALFDQQATSYDKQWERMAPISNTLYFLLEAVFSGLPSDARILCVGAGTGRELLYLAKRFPGWRFTAVEPSSAMLAVCRQNAEQAGVASRCYFHEGYLDSLTNHELHDAATSFLVSQFIVDRDARSRFFCEISDRLKPGGLLANADLSSDTASDNFAVMLEMWLTLMSGAGVPQEAIDRARSAYTSDVAVLPSRDVASIIASGGFQNPLEFFQAGLIRGWFARST